MTRTLLRKTTATLLQVAALLVPRRCTICGRRLEAGEHCVCAACTLTLPYTRYSHLRNNPVEMLFIGRFPLGRAGAYLLYNSGAATPQLLYTLKYRHGARIGREFGRRMAVEMLGYGFFEGIDAIVPVPLSPRRERLRGYNQSLMIALGISSVTGIDVDCEILKRTIDNPTQTRLSRHERMANVNGIFATRHPERIVGRHLLLVDDMVTTGATLTACADTLTTASAARISIVSLAASVNIGAW